MYATSNKSNNTYSTLPIQNECIFFSQEENYCIDFEFSFPLTEEQENEDSSQFLKDYPKKKKSCSFQASQ